MRNREIVQFIAEKLIGYEYTVYLSASGEHGFYTDGKRVVSFQSELGFVRFSGNYALSRDRGTGWMIAERQCDVTREQAAEYIAANAPEWTRNVSPVYDTPEQHLRTFGKFSGFKLYELV